MSLTRHFHAPLVLIIILNAVVDYILLIKGMMFYMCESCTTSSSFFARLSASEENSSELLYNRCQKARLSRVMTQSSQLFPIQLGTSVLCLIIKQG